MPVPTGNVYAAIGGVSVEVHTVWNRLDGRQWRDLDPEDQAAEIIDALGGVLIFAAKAGFDWADLSDSAARATVGELAFINRHGWDVPVEF